MPIIPTLKQTQRIQVGSPGGLPSGGAGLMAKAVGSFASGLSDLGRVLDAEDKRTKAAKDRITSSNMDSDVRMAFSKARDEISKAGGDGDNDVESLDESHKRIFADLKKQYGTEHHGELGAIGKKYLAASTDKVIAGSVEKRKSAINQGIDRLNSTFSSAVYNDPDSIFEHLQLSRQSVGMTLREDFGMDEERVNEEMFKADKRLIMSRIQGLMKSERYDNAIEDINSGAFSKYFTGEEATKAIEAIEKKRYTTAQRGYALENMAEAKVAKEFKVSQEKNFISLLKMANDGFGDPKQMKVVEDMMDAYKEEGLLTVNSATKIRNSIEGKNKAVSQNTRFDIVFDLEEGTLTPDEAMDKINRSVIKGHLTYKDAEAMVYKVKQSMSAKSKGDAVNRSGSRGWLKAHLTTGELDISGIPRNPEERQILADATVYMNGLVLNKGMSWNDAAQESARKYGKAPFNMPLIPGIPATEQGDLTSLRKAGSDVTLQFQSGAISKKEYVDRMNKVEEKLKILELHSRPSKMILDKVTSLKPDATINIPFRPEE